MRKSKGFALIQAMLFMMFIAAAISVSMVVKVNDSAKAAPAAAVTNTFPVVQGFITYALKQLDSGNNSVNAGTVYSTSGGNGSNADSYSDSYVNSQYKTSLNDDGFNVDNMTVTVEYQ